MANVFISYAKEDRTFVDSFAAALDIAGHHVWFDRDLRAGPFRDQILANLMLADVAVVVWSARSIESRYVLDESERAVSRGVLLPVRVDGAELPLGFGDIQTFDLALWSGQADDPAFKVVLDQIEHLAKNPYPSRSRPAVHFIGNSLVLAVSLAAACGSALAYLDAAKHGRPVSSIGIIDLGEAFALSLICGIPVMLWCGFQISRFGLSRTSPILRRALRIYALSAILSLAVMVAAVAAGATQDLRASTALAQLIFVGLLGTLVIGAVIAVVQAGARILGNFTRV
jgi:TIR domain